MPDGLITISQHYERKVNLSAISSQYDNISIGSFISVQMPSSATDEEIKATMAKCHDLVYEETENNIQQTFTKLKIKSQDEDNLAVIGVGYTLRGFDDKKAIEEQKATSEEKTPEGEELTDDDWNAFFGTSSKSAMKKEDANDIPEAQEEKKPEKEKKTTSRKKQAADSKVKNDDWLPEEVDLDGFNPDDYQGGILG